MSDAAQAILEALEERTQIDPLTATQAHLSVDEAYEIAAEIHRTRMAAGERPVGRKIGFTNRTIWAQYDVDSPIFGFMYQGTVSFAEDNRARQDVGKLLQPRIEPEIVLRFAHTPPSGKQLAALPSDDHRERAILECIEWIAHGFEIVQCPYPGWRFKAVDTMAAAGLHGALVVGEPVAVDSLDNAIEALREFKIALCRDSIVQARGGGELVLGSPLLAYAYLSDLLSRLPRFSAVDAGEIVTTGTLTDALPTKPGEIWSTKLTGIGLPGLTLTT